MRSKKLKKCLKKYVPEIIKKIIIWYLNNRVIINLYRTSYPKRALLSYITLPFKKDSLSHTVFFEARSWAKILDELGYSVDIVHFESTKSLDLSKYDLICGFGNVFGQYFENFKNCKAKTVYYATGMHVCHQNNATLQRVKDVYVKKHVWLAKSARFVEKTWAHQTKLVDAIIALGNEVCANSYRKFYDGCVYSLPAPFYKTLNAETVIAQRSENSMKHYLWFGSSGLVHKGLDLCLEYFARNQDIYLHICGPIENEPEFAAAYKKELYQTPNILTHGFINIASKEFKDILVSCSFVIFPSCSEGGAPSVLTAIGNGGLIPIITKETTINTGYEIWIDSLDLKGIDMAIQKSKKLTFDEVKRMQYDNQKVVAQNHSQEKYYNNLKKYVVKIIRENDDM